MKLFVLLSRVPYPLEKGDKLRAFYQLKHLSKKHEIILCALNDTALHPQASEILKKYCRHLTIINIPKKNIPFNVASALFKKLPLQVGYFYNKKAGRIIDKLIETHKPDHIFCQLIRTSEYVKNIKHIPKTLDYMDALSLGMERRLNYSSPLYRLVIKREAKMLKRYEANIFEYFDNKIIISENDRACIPHENKSSIRVIKNGIDTDIFFPLPAVKKYDLLFNGNMNYPPNIIAAEFLVNKVLPLVKQKYPGIKLLLSGADPSWRVKRLSSESVTVSGWVEDIRTSYAQSKIFIAPMHTGSGLQNKLLEAMAMKVPCITSPLANAAIEAIPGVHLLTAETPAGYAGEVISLLSDEERKNKIANEGYLFIKNNFSWEATVNQLKKIMFPQEEK